VGTAGGAARPSRRLCRLRFAAGNLVQQSPDGFRAASAKRPQQSAYESVRDGVWPGDDLLQCRPRRLLESLVGIHRDVVIEHRVSDESVRNHALSTRHRESEIPASEVTRFLSDAPHERPGRDEVDITPEGGEAA
jgi:hypothetical protein